MKEVLSVRHLRKEYKNIVALEDFCIQIEEGQVFGLLGPNGSGKTTLLGMLLGVTRPTSGSFSWFKNGNLDANRKKIGALLETPNFYPYLNAIENLSIVGTIKDVDNTAKAIEKELKRVNLWKRRKSKFKTYSLGMKQRLAIASCMLANPDVLVLDEPTISLDPQGIAEIRSLIVEIANEGKTIIIASHLLDEIEKICTHAAIIKHGKMLQTGSLKEIMMEERMIIIQSEDLQKLKDVIKQENTISFIKELDGELLVSAGDLTNSNVNMHFANRGIYLSGIRDHKTNLESTFLSITK